MLSTLRRARLCAISTFSDVPNATPGVCSPSRSVVSKIYILFMLFFPLIIVDIDIFNGVLFFKNVLISEFSNINTFLK